MKKLKKLITVKEAIDEHNKSRGWVGDIYLSQRILISCLAELKTISTLLPLRQKKKLSKYNVFFAKYAKKGKSAQEIAKMWKEKR